MMNKLPVKRDEWKQYLEEGQRNSVTAILDFGKRIYEYKQNCEVTQGGSTFGQDIKEWLGISRQAGEHWAKIGAKYNILDTNSIGLPQSWRSIYLLTTLSNEAFENAIKEGAINPNSTQRDVIDYKNRLNYKSKTEAHDKEKEEKSEERKFKPVKKSIKKDKPDKTQKENKRKEENFDYKFTDEDREKIRENIDKKYSSDTEFKKQDVEVMGRGEAAAIMGIPGCMFPNVDILKAIFRYWSKKYHPDMGGDHDKMVQINKAYEALK